MSMGTRVRPAAAEARVVARVSDLSAMVDEARWYKIYSREVLYEYSTSVDDDESGVVVQSGVWQVVIGRRSCGWEAPVAWAPSNQSPRRTS